MIPRDREGRRGNLGRLCGATRGLLMKRCEWAEKSELERAYHDKEWGVPVHDDRSLFEFLILEGAQAGLSWSTILGKREGYRKAFHHFHARRIARYTEHDVARLLADPGIVRNRLKIRAVITNAEAFLKVQELAGSFDRYLWGFVHGRPLCHAWETTAVIPSRSPESDAMSADLQKKGFRFVGTTICYAFMQAVGMVNDHVVGCFRCEELKCLSGISKSRALLRRYS